MSGSSPSAFLLYITSYSALSCLSVLMLYSIMCRCCRGSNNNRNHSTGPTISLYMGDCGLQAAVIEGFPKFAYSNKGICTDIDTLTNGECVVCLGEFEENEILRLLPKCGHIFHIDCIDTWLQSHITCPLCRANLLVSGDSSLQHNPFRSEV